ncbi:MAG: endonuclease/exonuclease/phosphatase family protein [Acutalibacteraceae bacterium]
MKVMSYNVLCYGKEGHDLELRLPLVLQRIREQMPDVLGTQESHKEWMDYLCAGMPEYAFVGVGREDGKEEGEYSPVFYRKDRFDLLDSGTFWLSETPDVPSKGWNAACMRVCSYALLKDKTDGTVFAAVNTHLDHISEQARDEGIRLVVEKLRSFGDIPVFCTGDFNTDEGSTCYKIMTDGFMADAKYVAADSDSGNTYHGFEPEATAGNSPIDFIFVKKDAVQVQSYRIVRGTIDGQQPSDHYAITAEISF